MLNRMTQVHVIPNGVQFTNATNHGLQLIRIEFVGEQPSIYAAAVSLQNGGLVHTPLTLSLTEIVAFVSRAKEARGLSPALGSNPSRSPIHEDGKV